MRKSTERKRKARRAEYEAKREAFFKTQADVGSTRHGGATVKPMTGEQWREAMETCNGETLVDYMAFVQDDNEAIRYTALVFGEHGKVAEVVSIPRNGNLKAVAAQMTAALERSMDAYDPSLAEDHRQLVIVCDMDYSRDEVRIPVIGQPMAALGMGPQS